MQISITRALAELKLTDKKILQKTNELKVAHTCRKENHELAKELIKKETARLQSITDLIARRNALKVGIVKSNAETNVTVGGKVMTVAAAIERKTSIVLDKTLLRTMRDSYYSVKDMHDRQNSNVEAQADEKAAQALNGDSESQGDAYEAVRKVYVDANKSYFEAIENVEDLIDKMQDEIDDFESEVDFVLSESNTKTMIEV